MSDWIDRKLDALEAHESQFESTMKAADASELDVFRRRITDRLVATGSRFGIGAAEAFASISDI